MTKDELVEKLREAVKDVEVAGANVVLDAQLAAEEIDEIIRAALAIAMPAAFEMAAEVASWAHMVPPDGGSPSEAECLVAKNAAAAIRELKEKWK